jgi:hypothetical protein
VSVLVFKGVTNELVQWVNSECEWLFAISRFFESFCVLIYYICCEQLSLCERVQWVNGTA